MCARLSLSLVVIYIIYIYVIIILYGLFYIYLIIYLYIFFCIYEIYCCSSISNKPTKQQKTKAGQWIQQQTVKADLYWHSPNWMNCGSLFTPAPAPVLAATSMLYRIPGTREGMTTEKVEPSTVLFIWYLVSLPRHQTFKKRTRNVKLVNYLSERKDQHSISVLDLDQVQTHHEPNTGCCKSHFSLGSSSERPLPVKPQVSSTFKTSLNCLIYFERIIMGKSIHFCSKTQVLIISPNQQGVFFLFKHLEIICQKGFAKSCVCTDKDQ